MPLCFTHFTNFRSYREGSGRQLLHFLTSKLSVARFSDLWHIKPDALFVRKIHAVRCAQSWRSLPASQGPEYGESFRRHNRPRLGLLDQTPLVTASAGLGADVEDPLCSL